MRHHAIIVTGWDKDTIEQAHVEATRLFVSDDPFEGLGEIVTPIVTAHINGYHSFMIAPDGSKEGWAHSDRGDEARAEFIQGLRESQTWLDWVEVQFGDDNLDTRIVSDSDHLPAAEAHD